MRNLNDFLNKGITDASDMARRFYLNNRKGQAFIMHAVSSMLKNAKARERYERDGTHIPPYLIASIATNCNLHCAGCYARANGACENNSELQTEMNVDQWQNIFKQASDIGVSIIMLAGGEPLMRRDIIELAAQFDTILFPIFTNGTMIDDAYMNLFDKHRNCIPVLSIEGNEDKTDARRGQGVSKKIQEAAGMLQAKKMLYGASITVTSENMMAVTARDFITDMRENGCGLLFFVEYVPAEEGTDNLTLSGDELNTLQHRIDALRNDENNKGVIMVSFPGDEEEMGGCLAAGRGFFHINANGGAEPCPFSPYSEMNLKEHSLLQVLQSSFFEQVRAIGAAEAINHKGGCTLFQHKEKVASINGSVKLSHSTC